MIPNKTTPTDYEIIDLIKERWSPRVFSEEIPKEDDVKRLFEAGPVSYTHLTLPTNREV